MTRRIRYGSFSIGERIVYLNQGDQYRLSKDCSIQIMSGCPCVSYSDNVLIIDCNENTKIKVFGHRY